MGSSKRLATYYDMRSQHQEILRAARSGPLQSLTDRELAFREQPVTIYHRRYRATSSRTRGLAALTAFYCQSSTTRKPLGNCAPTSSV